MASLRRVAVRMMVVLVKLPKILLISGQEGFEDMRDYIWFIDVWL
jgi:hypothetical protein